MKKELAIIITLLTLTPAIFGVLIRDDTRIFTDETPSGKDRAGSYSVLAAQYSFNDYEGHVILRMGGRVREFSAITATEEWSWTPGRVASPNNPTSIDAIDYEGTGNTNDVAYMSTSKEVTIREGETESKSDIYWSYEFTDDVYSLRAVDIDEDGRRDDLIVAAGNRLYTFKPAEKDGPIDSFQVSITPRIIALADVDSDGKNDDIVVGTWTTTTTGDDEEETSGGLITVYDLSGNRGWSFPQTALNQKVTSIDAYDRDSDGRSDDLLVLFTDDSNPDSPESDLYIVAGGSQVFFTSNVEDVAPADFDMDGIRDDFILLTSTQIFAFNSGTSDTQPSAIGGKSRSDFNTTVDGQSPTRFLGVAALSLQTKSGENIYNDAAIFSVIKETEDQRAIFFVENLVSEETTTTTTSTTSTTTTTTTLLPQPPTARITGISDGTTVSEGSTYPLSASTSSDPDGQIVSYQWLVNDILRGTNKGFSFSSQGLSAGAHIITLKVTDNDGMVGVTTITISIAVGNVPPIAKAGDDAAVLEGAVVILSAEGSSDPDGEIEFYEWSENNTVFSLEQNVEKT
ncbi:MAG: PKD domain-containing protein, partial [Candidatus Hydrothermarchaeales archaeon]